ncbi:MAG: peroxiredoxin [Thermoplasmata archaeon]|nr:peroxiredoxin [Thermoplasmata archaeon]
MPSKLVEGATAPDFALRSQTGENVRLNDFIDKKVVVLYFYPKDFTPGCTTEACTFRDSYEDFKDLGAQVIGISSDSVESHKKFAQKYNLPFQLLSDEDGEVRELYGAQKSGGLSTRSTFVIDKKGVIRMIFSSQLQARKHIEEALGIVKLLVQ